MMSTTNPTVGEAQPEPEASELQIADCGSQIEAAAIRNGDNVPQDRRVWITANIVCRDEFSTMVDQYEGVAEWHQETQDFWNPITRLSIRRGFEDELVILEWMELEERARGCPPSETDLSANIWSYREGEMLRGAGFYAALRIRHIPTGYTLQEDSFEGPFPTQAHAIAELQRMFCRRVVELTKALNRDDATSATESGVAA